VGNDNTHPTQAGHDAIAAAVASGIASRVLAR
jgi:phospholipase/lecithinase/hemolysin